VTSLNSESMITNHHLVGEVMFGRWNKTDVPSTAMTGDSSSLILFDSEHRLQILQQLRTTLLSLTIRCPTKWRRQQWP